MKSIRDLFKPQGGGPAGETTAEKHGDLAMAEPWRPLGGAQSLAEAEAFEQAAEVAREIDDLSYDLSAVIANILGDDTKDQAGKITAMMAVLEEARAMLPVIASEAAAEKAGRTMSQANLDRLHTSMADTAKVHDGVCDMADGCPMSAEKADRVEVVETEGRTFAIKGADGIARWVAIWTNAYQDKQGEVIRDSAHREYVDAVEKGFPLPTLRLWHVPGADIGKAEMVDYDAPFMLAVGTYDRPEYAERLKSLGPLKCSHRLRYRYSDKSSDGSFWRYRTDEITVLPAGAEANPLTGFDPGTEEPMQTKMRDFLASVLGEEKVAGLESDMKTLKARADAEGLQMKDILGGLAEPPEAPPSPPPALTIDAVKAAVAEIVAPLAQQVSALQADAEAAKALPAVTSAPRVTPPGAASTSPETVVTSGPLLEAAKAAEESGSADGATPAHLKQYMGMLKGANNTPEAVAR